MKKIGLKVLNVGIAFIMLFSGVAGLGDVLLNAAEITAANAQNESETTTSVGDEETSEVVEETTTEETTVAVEESTDIVEESTDVIKSAAEEPNMVVQAAISEEEQQLLNQLNPRMKSLESEQTDFLAAEDTPESFIVFLKEDQQLYNSATEVFSASAGKSVAPELSTLIVKKDEANLPDEQFISTLSNLSSVESVVKNTVSQMTNYEVSAEKLDTTVVENFSTVDSYGVPNDPLYTYQWEMQQMQMSKVWDLGTGKGVKIGIFDTGFQSAYRDSTGVEFDTNRILPVVRYAEDNTCYSSGEHGTMVMSIAGAVKSNNGIGMAGVASSATFQPYIAGYSCSGGRFGLSSANFVKVYEHALANGVNIMNMSFGGTGYNAAENTVIQRATQKGLISVAARGNNGRESNPTVTNYPACYSGVIMVGALTQSNTLADFSTYSDCGNKNLVTAYGEGVRVVSSTADSLYSTTVDGTSFSAPITAGVLAIMKSAKPGATATELKNALLSTATDLGAGGYDQRYGYGGINPLAAIQKLDPYTIVSGANIFYLNKDMTIKYVEKYASGKIIQIYHYHSGTKYGGAIGNRIKTIFYLDKDKNILSAESRADYSTTANKYYSYHKGTKYGGATGNRIKTIFYVDKYKNILSAESRADYSTTANKYYSYHKGTKYGGAIGNRIKTIFYVDKYKNILSAESRADYSTTANKYYSYHKGTKYGGATGNRIKTIFYVDKYKNILSAESRADYSTTANKYYSYHKGTKYGGAIGNRIKTIFYVDKYKNILSAESRADYSTTANRYYNYHKGTKYGGAVGNRIKTIFYVDKYSNIIRSEARKDYSTKVERYYEYHNGTKYGGAIGNRIKNIFYIDENGFIEKSESRKLFETKATKYYYYLPGTEYGKNHEGRVIQ